MHLKEDIPTKISLISFYFGVKIERLTFSKVIIFDIFWKKSIEQLREMIPAYGKESWPLKG